MQCFRGTLLVLCVFLSISAKADNIPIFQINNALFTFEPGGEAVAFGEFNFYGPGITIWSVVVFDCPLGWCSNNTFGYAAQGTPITFGSFSVTSLTVIMGGKTYSGAQAMLNAWTMNPLTDLAVPDSGGNAILNGNGLISGSITTANGVLPFDIKVPVGSLGFNFVQNYANPSYYSFFAGSFSATSTVPEPSTATLTLAGLAGLLGTWWSRKRVSSA